MSSAGINEGGQLVAVGNIEPTFPNPTYLINQVYMHCYFVVPIESYDKAIQEKIESGAGIDIHFDTFSTSSRQVAAGTAQTVTFQERAVSVRGALAVMRNAGTENEVRVDTIWSDNGITEFQWKIGQNYFPSQPVLCGNGGPEAWKELQESMGTWADTSSSGLITADTFLPIYKRNVSTDMPVAPGAAASQDQVEMWQERNKSNKFVIGLNLEKSTGQVSGFNTSATNTDIELNLKFKNRTLDPIRVRKVPPVITTGGGDNTTIAHDIPSPLTYVIGAGKFGSHSQLGVMRNVANPVEGGNYRIILYAHIDAVLQIQGLGSIQVLR